MSKQKAEVIQGRLGWESGDVSEAKTSELEPHPKNKEIYGDTAELEDAFVESICEKGVLEPLVITKDKQVISGHRRLSAAKQVGIETVPVRISEFDDELVEREALIEFNRQREKTPGQIVNEFEEMLEIEEERAKERQAEAGEQNLPTTNGISSGNVSQTNDEERARDKAAKKINADVSGRTLEKGKKVKDKAEEGDETAQEQWEKLKNGDTSFHSAHSTVKEEEQDNDNSDIEQFTSQKTDEWSSPRELVEPLDEAIGGFDLDPCSGAEQSPFAEETYTEEDDGLAQDWFGDVWVNPPYSEMEAWTNKAVKESQNAESIYYLCKGDSSTEWWQSAAKDCSLIVAIDHRLQFGDGENSAPFASHIMVFGTPNDNIISELNKQGTILSPIKAGDSNE